MSGMKRGTIVQMNRNDGIAVIREDGTSTEYLIILSELSKQQAKTIKPQSVVTFERSPNYEQFVATHIRVEENFYGKVI